MPTITAIKKQRQNRKRVNIHLDGSFSFDLALNQTDLLRVGHQLSQEDITELQIKDEVEKAFERAVKYLSYRPRTKTEVRRRLEKLKFHHNVIASVIDRLLQNKMVDDVAFAAFWVENRTTFRPRGHRALLAELRNKGVEQEIIDAALAGVDEAAAAEDAAKRRVPRLAHLPELEFRHKLWGFLRRRGFEHDVIVMVVDELLRDRRITTA